MKNTFRAINLLFLCLSFGISGIQKAEAQHFYNPTEYGFQFGASTYFGDLNTNYGLHYIRPAAGAYIRHSFNPYISLKGAFNLTKIGFEDRFSRNEFQKIRNLSFESNIAEVAVLAEFNFFRFETGDKYHRFTPYLTGGFGAFLFDPYIIFNKQKYKLKSVATEGQNTGRYDERKYQNYSFCFPVGVGIKYWLRPGVNLGVELINRFTLTDYLDDVSNTYVGIQNFSTDPNHLTPTGSIQDPSIPVNDKKLGREGKQRGDNSTMDQYMILNFSFSFQFKTYKCPSRDYYDMYNR